MPALDQPRRLRGLAQRERARHVHLELAGRDEVERERVGVVTERQLRRAVTLNDNHAEAHWAFGSVLPTVALLAEAIEEMRKALVLDPHHSELAAQVQRFESSETLAERVRADRQGIGFSSLATVHGAKVLAIAEGDAPAMLPTPTLVASEDYPLSRRLFFYLPARAAPLAVALAEYTQTPAGQAIVARQGFVAQQVKALPVPAQADMPPRYRTLAAEARRLTVNFRFQPGSANLDNKALRDVRRVADYLRQAGKLQHQVVLVGFGDPKETQGRAALLSRLRAMAVRRELARDGVETKEVTGMGDELPVADNDQEQGRLRNRRVEVWVY